MGPLSKAPPGETVEMKKKHISRAAPGAGRQSYGQCGDPRRLAEEVSEQPGPCDGLVTPEAPSMEKVDRMIADVQAQIKWSLSHVECERGSVHHGGSRHETHITIHDLARGLGQDNRLEHAVPGGWGSRRFS